MVALFLVPGLSSQVIQSFREAEPLQERRLVRRIDPGVDPSRSNGPSTTGGRLPLGSGVPRPGSAEREGESGGPIP